LISDGNGDYIRFGITKRSLQGFLNVDLKGNKYTYIGELYQINEGHSLSFSEINSYKADGNIEKVTAEINLELDAQAHERVDVTFKLIEDFEKIIPDKFKDMVTEILLGYFAEPYKVKVKKGSIKITSSTGETVYSIDQKDTFGEGELGKINNLKEPTMWYNYLCGIDPKAQTLYLKMDYGTLRDEREWYIKDLFDKKLGEIFKRDIKKNLILKKKIEKNPSVPAVVKDIYKKNAQVFDRFKGFVEAGLSITYIMGNHDRLINSDGYDAIRKYIQEKLRLTPTTGQKFPWKYSVDGLPIYAVHGNDFDIYNKTENSSLPIGDAIVTLLINQYPEEVKKALEEKDAPNATQVYKALQEIDNLRPSTVTPYWIDYVKKSLQPDDQSLLVDTWNNLSEKFFDNGFVKDWFQKNDYWSFLPDAADKLEIAFRHFTDTKLGRAYEKFLEIKKDFIKETDQNAVAALKLINSNKCDYVLFGHTGTVNEFV
ncbi:MAG: hypothetical protein AAB013_06695, partial [Planctomycetota bacterium]